MEITCQQCSTLFMVDVGLNPGAELEVVCPGCFQLYRVQLPSQPKKPEGSAEGRSSRGRLQPGDGGVAERLRDGFTLHFELRHPARPEVLKLNPFVIKQRIWTGQLDGTEEFRENQGRWFRVGEHPEFARLFQLKGLRINTESAEPQGGGQRRFAGWKHALPPPPSATEVEPTQGSELSLPLASVGREHVPGLSRKKARWPLLLGGGLLLVVLVGLLLYFFVL